MKIKKLWCSRRLVQIIAAVSVSISFMLAGLCGAWTSPTLPYLLSNHSHIHLTPDESSWMVSFMPIGTLIVIIPFGYSTTFFGRKTILSAGALPYFLSWILIVFANTTWELYIARIFCGIGVLISFTISPLYLAEISEDDIRGILITLTQVSFNLGTLVEYSIGPYVSFTTLASISAVFPAVFFFIVIWIPESPYYLLSQGLIDKAQASLVQLRGAEDSNGVQQELKLMQMAVEDALKIERAPLKDLFMKTGNRRALIIVLSMIALQQSVGQLAVVSYATQIFQSSTASVLDPNICVIILGGMQTLSSIILSSQVDRVGRRPLLIISGGGTALCMLIVSIYFYVESNTDADVSSVGWLPLVSLILYLPLHSLALGVVPLAVMGEVFPTNVKNLAATISLMCITLGAITTIKLFQIMADGIGVYSPFLLYSVLGILGTVFVFWYIPETKGKSFIQIQDELEAPEYPKKHSTIKPNPS